MMADRTVWATLAVVAALVAIALPAESLAQGCAMCGTYLSANDPRTQAFKTSILFLMAMPFAVVGSVGGWVAWMYRGHRLRLTAQPAMQVLQAEGEAVS